MAVKIFFCYAREDEAFLNKLKTHLSLLQRQGRIEFWYDRDISAGMEWEQEISKQLNEADIIVLLVSAYFLASDYCYDIEMQRALERHELGEAYVIPIILRPSDWQIAPFARLQALPENGKPITEWRNRDTAFNSIVAQIYRLIKRRNTDHRMA